MKGVGALLAVLLLAAPAAAQPPKSGGVINLMQREELAVGFAIHETATIATVWVRLHRGRARLLHILSQDKQS